MGGGRGNGEKEERWKRGKEGKEEEKGLYKSRVHLLIFGFTI